MTTHIRLGLISALALVLITACGAGFAAPLEHQTEDASTPVVFMTTDISPKGLMAVYEALKWTPSGKVAVKISTGEPPASNYLRPELIQDLVRHVNGTIVECGL